MTYLEVRNLLSDMRAAKRRANSIKARIADLESDAESINSALNNSGVSGGSMRSRVEELALKIESEREKHVAALETYFALEDKLSTALDSLDPIEKDVIIGCYLDGKYNWQVGESIGYSVETIKRKKRSAIRKISEKL
jgi:RNA polymerase sigma factor (sigma-70 family)